MSLLLFFLPDTVFFPSWGSFELISQKELPLSQIKVAPAFYTEANGTHREDNETDRFCLNQGTGKQISISLKLYFITAVKIAV